MRSFNLGIVGALIAGSIVASSMARAADFPTYQKAPSAAEAVYNWSGFHIGGNVGYGFSEQSNAIAGANAIGGMVVQSGAVPSSIKTEPRGFVGGVQIGYDKQFASWVLGVEADFNGSNVNGRDGRVVDLSQLIGQPLSLTTNASSKLDWYGTVRGKVGFTPINRVLLFATGGLAYGKITDNTSISLVGPGAPGGLNGSTAGGISSNKLGYVVGGGVEYAAMQNMTFFTKYEYLNFGSHTEAMTATVMNTPVAFTSKHTDEFHTVKVGVNWKFGS